MESKQERDKPVRTFVARLRGLANICILFKQCTDDTCTKTVSHVEPTILLDLVKGLVDADTKGDLLSQVKRMDLDETVAFMEARETGKRDLVLLNGGPYASQVNGVQVQGKCWRCGQERHSGKYDLQSLQLQMLEVQPGRTLHQGLLDDRREED